MHLFSRSPPPPDPPLGFGERMRLMLTTHYRGLVPSIISLFFAILMVRPSAEKPVLLIYVIIILTSVFLIWPMHIGISSFITVFTLPILGILSSAHSSQCYLTDAAMLWICSTAVAISWQQSRNPYRCILCIMKLCGTSHGRLLFGVCFVTAFMSILLPNYMATLMMMPILSKLIQIFQRQPNVEPPYKTETKGGVTTTTPSTYVIAYYLGVAYSSNVGSLCFLISSPATMAVKAQYAIFSATPFDLGSSSSSVEIIHQTLMSLRLACASVYEKSPDILSVVGFLYYSFSCMLMLFIALYLYLLYFCMGKNKSNASLSQAMDEFCHTMDRERSALGDMPLRECIIVCMLLLLLALTVSSNFPWGWRSFAEETFVPADKLAKYTNYVGESALFAIAFIFIHSTPFKKDLFKYFSSSHRADMPPKKEMENLCEYKKATNANMPWTLWLLMGTGVAVMRSYMYVNASAYLGPSFAIFESSSILVATFIFAAIVALLSNAVVHMGACHLVMPFAITVALHTHLHPAVLPYTVAAASNFTYMLPVAWSAIKVVKDNGKIPLKTLIYYGIGATVISLLVFMVNIYINTMLYGWDKAPAEDWTVAGAASGGGGGGGGGVGGDSPADNSGGGAADGGGNEEPPP